MPSVLGGIIVGVHLVLTANLEIRPTKQLLQGTRKPKEKLSCGGFTPLPSQTISVSVSFTYSKLAIRVAQFQTLKKLLR